MTKFQKARRYADLVLTHPELFNTELVNTVQLACGQYRDKPKFVQMLQHTMKIHPYQHLHRTVVRHAIELADRLDQVVAENAPAGDVVELRPEVIA